MFQLTETEGGGMDVLMTDEARTWITARGGSLAVNLISFST